VENEEEQHHHHHPQEEEEEEQQQQQQQQSHKQTMVRGEEGRGMVPIDKRWVMMKGLKEGWGIATVNIKYNMESDRARERKTIERMHISLYYNIRR
jgi:hypothetical protein